MDDVIHNFIATLSPIGPAINFQYRFTLNIMKLSPATVLLKRSNLTDSSALLRHRGVREEWLLHRDSSSNEKIF